ncbi:probable sugar phosphate/phosphate translocator At3g14410 isoform X2 [Zingiber officinale]|uniref:probable sugar phosphate/phosphate translocator At3g14410 isoform X2 n=1 Tax=Zingiber officinale TaxID=94328 RepID=UPI001C4D1B2E|nr:probable sugar phosphate/phosphate translocator At3g14410 isoform X2 [Zingiber officinale]
MSNTCSSLSSPAVGLCPSHRRTVELVPPLPISFTFCLVRGGGMARSGRHLRFGGEKAADLIRRCGEGGIIYGCIFLYISVSSGQIFFNKIYHISHSNWCHVCNDSLARKYCLPLYISCICSNAESTMPVAVFFLGAAAGLEAMSCKMFTIMLAISIGVVVASYGEISISWVGVVYRMGGVVGEASRLIFMEIFVKKKGVRLNPISMM